MNPMDATVRPDADGRLHLTKHEAAGNDFLIIMDLADETPVGAALARWLCDRHRGVGADGVIRVGRGREGAPVSMHLTNADGSPAELSGNGLRCLAQAVVAAGHVQHPEFVVWTPAGLRVVRYRPAPEPGTGWATTDMGPVRLGAEVVSPLERGRAVEVDAGNPHLVVECPDPARIDVAGVWRAIEAGYPGGVNVEFVAPDGPDRLAVRIWERGVGETLACGTGACAVAVAARSWGLVGDRVGVVSAGGLLEVVLDAQGGAQLSGPVRKVADLQIDLAAARAAALELIEVPTPA
jgi:diaminopimelate epimerase